MSQIEFAEDNELSAVVEAIISKSTSPALAEVRNQKLKISPVLKIRTNNDGEHEPNAGLTAKITKVNDMWKVFVDSHYILVVDYYFFHHANCRDAGIFNALCEIEVEAKDGEIKLKTKKPDLMVFAATLQEYGAYDDLLLGLREWMNNAKTKAAKSFAEKISTGTLDEAEQTTEEERPEIHAGPVEDEGEIPRRRGGRKAAVA